jgi:glutathione synthase
MKILFLMYPWNRIQPETDSTLRLIHESVYRNNTVAIATVNNLTIRESVASVFCDVFIKRDNVTNNIQSFYKKAEFRRRQLPLGGFDAIFMRSNPPLDTLALNFLDSVQLDSFIINDINGLRVANNKLYTTSLYDQGNSFIPLTYVSKNREYLERIFNESEDDKMILKPLNGFGGHGVIVIEKGAKHNFRSLLDFYIEKTSLNDGNYVILQEYVKGAENGDIRILMLNGKPIGSMRRVPEQGEIRSNVHVGGKAVKHVLTKKEKELCLFIGDKLVGDGIYFAGLDVIGDKVIEVNVQSPGGISRINLLNRTCLQKNILDFVEGVVNTREMKINRKKQFRKVIDDESDF